MQDFQKFLKTNQKYLDLLKTAWIASIKEFFQYFPRVHEDRASFKMLNEITSDQEIYSVKVKIVDKSMIFARGKKIIEFICEDQNGDQTKATYYNAQFMYTQIEKDHSYILIGKPKIIKKKVVFWHPELIRLGSSSELLGTSASTLTPDEEIHNIGRLYPVYTEVLWIKSTRFAKKIRDHLNEIPQYFKEYLPDDFLKQFNLLDLAQTIKQMHFPESTELKRKATQRVFFDRLLKMQLQSQMNKLVYQSDYHDDFTHKNAQQPDRDLVKMIVGKLPFELTNAQKKVIKAMIEDFHSPQPMLRLLQGDVGSGKTVVAAIAAFYIVKKFGGQVVFLAPLQVLADQHHRTLGKILLPLGINVQGITGSYTAGQKEKTKKDLANGSIDVIVGTHAVIQEDVRFHNLKFAVIDEQHKFGVKQRAFFRRFQSPHVLQMSATPIPRSLALAYFGEFDVSVIDELPKGRKDITTKIIDEKELKKLKPRILTKLSQDQRVFIVTPLIEESDKVDNLKAAKVEYQEICELYPELKGKIGLLHGKMKPKEKDEIMAKFKRGHYMILVSTTVIEVWVDVSQASIIIIKNSERFGLSQLHQLRGRVGRSDIQSYCFLETKQKSGDTYKRLRVMEETNDGFKLAELDLQFRGAGELMGTRQAGETDFPLEIISDVKFIEQVQAGARRLLERYPDLEWIPELKSQINENIGQMIA